MRNTSQFFKSTDIYDYFTSAPEIVVGETVTVTSNMLKGRNKKVVRLLMLYRRIKEKGRKFASSFDQKMALLLC